VSVDIGGACPIGGKSISESNILRPPDSRSPSILNRVNANESLAYGTTAAVAVSC
jgi:hypothetical protein